RRAWGAHDEVRGLEEVDKVINIDQTPIGFSPRSNPATYVKVFDAFRKLYSQIPEAKVRGYSPGQFSFNSKRGRCEACTGLGSRCIEMHFLPDLFVTCEACNGSRYNRETLQITYKGQNISQVLDMTVAEARELFGNVPRLDRMLGTLASVGLDYVKVGQPATTLSGGEAQRVKLAKELSR
ncbi:MAG: excinuclease ABC subunit UvrA, partial [Nitrospinota bacterium]|nr:excinuclease ABC subunit UvrA [Nitrospinota bacterium]